MADRACVAPGRTGDTEVTDAPLAKAKKEQQMYIGLGTLVLVVILILILT